MLNPQFCLRSSKNWIMGCWKTRIQSATLTLTLPLDPFERLVCDDRSDAYFHVAIYPAHRRFLRLAYRGAAYEFQRILFGLSLALRVFTKCVEAALFPLRNSGIRIFSYTLSLTGAGDHRFRDGNKSPQTPRIHNKRRKESVGAVKYTEYLRLSINSLFYCAMLSKYSEATFHFSARECGDVQSVSPSSRTDGICDIGGAFGATHGIFSSW